ncbi:MAG: glycoside hydrolase family 26 protein [Chitinispirillaceae bacterium]
MRRKLFVFLILVLYAGLVVGLFAGIKRFEQGARQWYFTNVTRRMVSKVSKLGEDKCVLGVYRPELPYSFKNSAELEKGIGTRFTLISIYQAWGEKDVHKFPTELMKAVDRKGCVPVLTWEPWVTDFTSEELRPMPLREKGSLKDIAQGEYDFYIQQWARNAVKWGKPFFLRFAHEMSNPQYPWTPQNGNTEEDYIRAWWHVRELFDSLGADNVIWVWSPYKAQDVRFYPGDEYVDWVALDIFNYGELIASGDHGRWRSFDQLLSPLYRSLEDIRKPVMIAEVGTTDMGGSREVWYREMFSQIASKFHKVKAVVFFDNPSDRTSGEWKIDWALTDETEVLEEIRNSVENGCFTYVPDYSHQLSDNKGVEK